jgi:WD40 repeat protein
MYLTTNILALVGGGKNPKFSINKIIIWDDQKKRNNIIGELRFNSPVLNVKMKQDRLIGICQSKIYIFNINTLETLDMFDTYDNINGIVGFSPGELICVLAFPYESRGKVRIVNFNSLAQPPIITAHESKIACLCVNRNGTLLATSSDKGTLVRIFDVKDGKLLIELRRGAKNAEINCIIFDEYNKLVACASGTGTVHIFSIVEAMKNNYNENYYSDQNDGDETKNQKSFLSGFNFLHKLSSSYFGSEWSFAKLRLQEHKSIISFLHNNTICALTSDGKYCLASFDPKKSGDCVKKYEFYIYDTNNQKDNKDNK